MPGYEVATDLRIVDFGDDTMMMFTTDRNKVNLEEDEPGVEMVTARREGAKWVVTVNDSHGGESVTADGRPEAITAMIELTLKNVPATGITVVVPHGLEDRP